MDPDRWFALRSLELGSGVLISHDLPQAQRSAPSRLVAATAALTLALPLLAAPALASSPAAWAAYDVTVRSACRKASQLVGVVERGARFDVSTPGLSLLVLEGRYPQPHMQGQRGVELCVYEQSSGRATVVEAEGLRRSFFQAELGTPPAPARPVMPPVRP